MTKRKTKKRKSPPAKMSAADGQALVQLANTAERYLRHPDVEAALGFQVSTAASMSMNELSWYLLDHVVSPEGEGITAKDRHLISGKLREVAELLAHPAVAKIPFSLPSTAFSRRLLEASSQLAR